MALPSAFHDLPRSAFPFTVELWSAAADRRGPPTFTARCEGPGALRIPGFGPGAWCRITYADSGPVIMAPDGADRADF